MTTIVTFTDSARLISLAYWEKTPHVFGKGYPEQTLCEFCDLPEASLQHVPATPKPKPTVAEVRDVSDSRLHAKFYALHGTCGHQPIQQHFNDLRKKPARAGDPFDCWTCDTSWHDQNFPGLPPDIREQIDALVPRCPECNEQVKYLPFIIFSKHDVFFELDAGPGDMVGTSQTYDTLDEQPEWEHNPSFLARDTTELADGWQTGEIAVSCENNHGWKTKRLAWKVNGKEHQWRIIDAPAS